MRPPGGVVINAGDRFESRIGSLLVGRSGGTR
jgi:hypothetical protein